MKNFLFRRLNDISIAKKLYFTVGIMALLIGVELFALFFSINTLSSVRAYVGGEGLWSKAQKDAVYQLLKYGNSRNVEDYEQYKEFMKVPLGDSKTRKELSKENPDFEIAKEGFVEGRNHPEDVDGMIKLFRRFGKISYISKAIKLWTEAESNAVLLIPIGERLHNEISSPNPSEEKIKAILKEIAPINKRLTALEDDFSYTLGEGSRWLEGLVLKLLFVIALTVEVTGLFLAISVSRGIQNGLSEIIAAAASFAKGVLNARAKVFSKDEIGVLASSFNQMSDKLEKSINELQQAEKKISGLLESAPDAIVIVDREGMIKLLNAQTVQLFGYEKSELLSQQIERIIPGNFKKWHLRYSTGYIEFPKVQGTRAGVMLYGKKKNGEEFPVEITLSPLQTEEGLLISAAIRDISERKYLKELESKNKELEQFAYIASHDLQEPLNTINSFISLLEEEHKDKLDKSGAEYLNYIRDSSNRMHFLITGILEYSRIGRKSQVEKVDCNKIFQEVLDDMQAAIAASNAKITGDNLPVLKGYPVELRLLFQNLLSNAIKFRNKDVAPEIKIHVRKENDYWHFTMEDNGIGIEGKYKEKIFIIFQRLHSMLAYEGTGIGLAHCKKIVELHDGKIWVESEPGKGSKFHFTLAEKEQLIS